MTVTIYTHSFYGGRGHKTSDSPDFAEAFRAAATDLDALQARSDSAMQTQLDLVTARQTTLRTAVDALITQYNLHRGVAGVHKEADSVNTIVAPVATDLTADMLTIVNDAYDMYVLHIAMDAGGAGVHPGGADTTNLITATYPATDYAEAAALMNDIKAKYEQHRANNGAAYHTNPDATNTIIEADATTWDTFITLANAFKNTTGWNAHVILTAGPTHGASDVAHVITAADCGVQVTAVYVELIEIKDDYSLHTASMGLHPNPGTVEGTADATDEATTIALVNALKATLNTNFADADVHMDADVLTVIAADATGYEDTLPILAEIRADYTAHIANTTVHAKADAVNVRTAVGAGGDVAALGTGSAVTLTLVSG